MFYLGIFVLLAAFVGLVWNLYISYETQCGGLGQDPVFGATIIQIPLLVLLGLNLLDDAGSLDLEWWHYPAIGLTLAVVLGWLVAWVGRLPNPKNKGPL